MKNGLTGHEFLGSGESANFYGTRPALRFLLRRSLRLRRPRHRYLPPHGRSNETPQDAITLSLFSPADHSVRWTSSSLVAGPSAWRLTHAVLSSSSVGRSRPLEGLSQGTNLLVIPGEQPHPPNEPPQRRDRAQ